MINKIVWKAALNSGYSKIKIRSIRPFGIVKNDGESNYNGLQFLWIKYSFLCTYSEQFLIKYFIVFFSKISLNISII